MEFFTPEIIQVMATQFPNWFGFGIMAILLVYQTQQAWKMANLILDRCIPDGDCPEKPIDDSDITES